MTGRGKEKEENRENDGEIIIYEVKDYNILTLQNIIYIKIKLHSSRNCVFYNFQTVTKGNHPQIYFMD